MAQFMGCKVARNDYISLVLFVLLGLQPFGCGATNPNSDSSLLCNRGDAASGIRQSFFQVLETLESEGARGGLAEYYSPAHGYAMYNPGQTLRNAIREAEAPPTLQDVLKERYGEGKGVALVDEGNQYFLAVIHLLMVVEKRGVDTTELRSWIWQDCVEASTLGAQYGNRESWEKEVALMIGE